MEQHHVDDHDADVDAYAADSVGPATHAGDDFHGEAAAVICEPVAFHDGHEPAAPDQRLPDDRADAVCLEGEDDQEQDRHGEGHGLTGVSFEIGDQACGNRAGCRIGHPCECADAFGGLGRTVCADGEPFMSQTPGADGEADDPCDGKDGDAGEQHRPGSGKRVER